MSDNALARILEINLHYLTHFRRILERLEDGRMETWGVRDGNRVNTTQNDIAFYSQAIADLEKVVKSLEDRNT